MRIFRKSEEELRQENKPVTDLIKEQRLKESIARRSFCISEATCALDDPTPDELIRLAKAIYEYVYANATEEE